jgi:hypothetical protein
MAECGCIRGVHGSPRVAEHEHVQQSQQMREAGGVQLGVKGLHGCEPRRRLRALPRACRRLVRRARAVSGRGPDLRVAVHALRRQPVQMRHEVQRHRGRRGGGGRLHV